MKLDRYKGKELQRRLGRNVKRRRIQQGFRQIDLSQFLGHETASTISKIESGAMIASILTVALIAEALDCTVDQLLKGE